MINNWYHSTLLLFASLIIVDNGSLLVGNLFRRYQPLLLLKTVVILNDESNRPSIQQKSLARALFLYILISEARPSGVRASITIVHIRKFNKS